MATKFLKSPNGGIYKDSNGKLVGVEPERVIRDIDGSIPASTLEDISVSTGTASTNGVSYIRATMKGKVTYTDNTHDTINYFIDLPIKAGDGVTIEAQPIEGATGNKQLVISASGGGGGTTLNKYTATINYSQESARARITRIFKNAKSVTAWEENYNGPVTFSVNNYNIVCCSVIGCYASGTKVMIFMEWLDSGTFQKSFKSYVFSVTNSDTGEITVKQEDGVLSNMSRMQITYYNDTEIT